MVRGRSSSAGREATACLDRPHEALREFEAAASAEFYPCAFHAASAYGAARRAGNPRRGSELIAHHPVLDRLGARVLARPMLLTIVYMTPLLTLFVAGTLGYPAGLVGAILLTACTFLAALAVAEAIGCWQGFILGLSTLAGSIGGTVIGCAYYFDYNDRIALIGGSDPV